MEKYTKETIISAKLFTSQVEFFPLQKADPFNFLSPVGAQHVQGGRLNLS